MLQRQERNMKIIIIIASFWIANASAAEESVHCALQDMSKPGGEIYFSGPTLWEGNVVLNKQAVTIDLKTKSVKLVGLDTTEKTKGELLFGVSTFGFGDLLITSRNSVAVGKNSVALIDV